MTRNDKAAAATVGSDEEYIEAQTRILSSEEYDKLVIKRLRARANRRQLLSLRLSPVEAAKRFAAAGHTNLTPGVKCSCCGNPVIPYKEHHCPTASEAGLQMPPRDRE